MKEENKELISKRREIRLRIVEKMIRDKKSNSPLNKVEDINKKIIRKEQGMIALSELIAEKVQVRDKKKSDKGKVDRNTDAECFSNLSQEIGNIRVEVSASESRNRKLRSDREG